jgi:hypothetical protein
MCRDHIEDAIDRHRRRTVRLVPILIVVAATAAPGCATARTASQVADNFVASSPGCAFERESRLVLGRASMAVVRGLAGLAGDDLDEQTREILRGVRRVEVVTYSVAPECDFRDTSPALPVRLTEQGWQPVISTADGPGESSWVLTRQRANGGTSGMLVVALDHHELEVVRLDGDIDRVLVAATADDPSTVRQLFDGDA